MERDFLGLNSKASVAVVNEEFKDGGKEAGMAGNSGMQWMAFSNKLTAVPQFTSFRGTTQEGRQKRLMFDPQMPSAFQPVSTPVFDSNYKPTDGLVQKTFNIERQGTHFAMPYPAQPVDAHGISALCGHEMRTFPVSKHSISPAMNSPFFKVYGSNIATASMKQHPLGGIPVTAPHSVFPVPGSMAGTYASWNNPRPSANSSQLTIFYKGTVNVYDDISAEKAQALMFSARHASANQMKPGTQLQALALAHPKPEPSSGHSSPVSVTSQHNTQSGSGSSNPADLLASKPIGVLSAPPNSQQESAPKMSTSASATLMQQAVPQARKASLARFLEKRKERVMNAAPYALCKSQESTPGSEAGGKSATASVDLVGNQDQSWSLGQHKKMDNPTVETKLEI